MVFVSIGGSAPFTGLKESKSRERETEMQNRGEGAAVKDKYDKKQVNTGRFREVEFLENNKHTGIQWTFTIFVSSKCFMVGLLCVCVHVGRVSLDLFLANLLI